MANNLKTFGRRFDASAFIRIREASGMTVKDVAKHLENMGSPHLNKNVIQSWEAGRTIPYIHNLQKLMEIFKCTLDELAPRIQ